MKLKNLNRVDPLLEQTYSSLKRAYEACGSDTVCMLSNGLIKLHYAQMLEELGLIAVDWPSSTPIGDNAEDICMVGLEYKVHKRALKRLKFETVMAFYWGLEWRKIRDVSQRESS